MTTFLTFSDETQAKEVLTGIAYFPAIQSQEEWTETIDGVDIIHPAVAFEEAYWKTADIGWACNILGTVYAPQEDPEQPPVPLEGFGVNWSGQLPEVCLPFVVELENPVNVFA
jgi:hypothetical protein